jgi:peptidyl-prolyl cis-trans isomerase C
VLEAALVSEASRAAPSDADVAAFRERYRGELDAPRTLSLWRILLASEADARAVIAQLSPPTEAAWSRLARERSTDRATHMRAGNLGRVAADGQTHMPELRVLPALFAAADRVQDGELVGVPVPEGDGFAVVWRRASQPARESSPAHVATTIAARLSEQRFAAARAQLIETLRREHLTEHQPERVASFEPRFPEPGAVRPRHGGELPSRPVRLLPELTDRGLR